MDEDRPNPMPQEPTNSLFLAAGSFGLLAFLIGFGLIVASSLGYLR
jgi:hypothetical protein